MLIETPNTSASSTDATSETSSAENAAEQPAPTGGTGTRPPTYEMIERFKRFFGFRFDTDMARKLELSDGSAIGNWRRRDSIDLLMIADYCPEINMDWLIWGRGTRNPPAPDEERMQPRDNLSYLQSLGVPREQIIMIVHEALESYLKENPAGKEKLAESAGADTPRATEDRPQSGTGEEQTGMTAGMTGGEGAPAPESAEDPAADRPNEGEA